MTSLGGGRTVIGMDRGDALSLIPAQYGVALRLSSRGASESEIAAALGIEPEAVGPLLDVAAAKLRRVLEGDRGTTQSASDTGTS